MMVNIYKCNVPNYEIQYYTKKINKPTSSNETQSVNTHKSIANKDHLSHFINSFWSMYNSDGMVPLGLYQGTSVKKPQ